MGAEDQFGALRVQTHTRGSGVIVIQRRKSHRATRNYCSNIPTSDWRKAGRLDNQADRRRIGLATELVLHHVGEAVRASVVGFRLIGYGSRAGLD